MGERLLVLFVIFALALASVPYATDVETASNNTVMSLEGPAVPSVDERDVEVALSGLDSHFQENLGQFPGEDADFVIGASGVSMAADEDGVSMTLVDPVSGEGHTLSICFEGGRDVAPTGARPAHTTSYFVGNDPDQWVKGARSFGEVVYEGIYDGVDARFYLRDGMLKYDLILAEGADVDHVLLRYGGADDLSVDPVSGDLLVSTPLGVLRDARPLVMTERSDDWVEASFSLHEDGSVGFVLPAGIQPGTPLTIDPGIKYSTFLGGDQSDSVYDVAVGDDGSIFALVYSMSDNLPLSTGAYGSKINDNEVGIYVAKFDPQLTTLKKATYVDGSASDSPESFTVLSDGSVLVTGNTASNDFPVTQDALMSDYTGSRDAFLVKLNPGFDDLVYSTYLGGNDNDHGLCVLEEADGDVVVLGTTASSDLNTTPGAINSTLWGGADAFIWTLDPTLKTTKVMTYIGSDGNDHFRAAAPATSGELVLLLDVANDSLFTHAGSFMSAPPEKTGSLYPYIVKMTSDGTAINAATYMSGNLSDVAEGLTVGSDGRVYVTIATTSADLPLTPNAIQTEVWTVSPERTAFLGVLAGDLKSLEFGTYYGGNSSTRTSHIALSRDEGTLAIAGKTTASDLQLTPGCFDPVRRGDDDVVIATFNTTSWDLEYATMWGDTEKDYVWGIEFNDDGFLVIGGYSEKFPMVEGAYRTSPEAGSDPLMAVLDPTPEDSPPDHAPMLELSTYNGSVHVRWDVVPSFTSRAIGYRLYKGLNVSGNDRELLNETGFEVLQYLDEDVINGIEYCYWISAVNYFGEGPLSTVARATPIGTPYNPRNLELTTGDGTVNVSWEHPLSDGGVPLLGWRVYRGETRDELELIADLDDGTATFYVDDDKDLEVGEFYYYQVECYNSHGASPRSPIARIRVLDQANPPPAFKVEPGDGEVIITWGLPTYDGGTMVLGFHVWRMTGGSEMDKIATLDATRLRFKDTNVTNGVSYTYMVTAITDVGDGRSTEPTDTVPFGLPGKVEVIEATPGEGNVTLTWQPPASDGGSRITGYTIYWGTSAGNLDRELLIGNLTSFAHEGLTNGVTHYYQVAPENAAGLGTVSIVVHATPMGRPGPVGDLEAVCVSGSVRITWTAPADKGGADSVTYRVLRGTTGDPTDILAELTGTLEHLDDTVSTGTTYRYRVVAVSDIGEGDGGSVVSVLAAVAPGQVTGLEATAGNANVDLSWSAPGADGGSPVTEYSVLKGVFEGTLTEVARVTVLEYSDTDVENGKTYYYAVAAVNVMGAGQRSDVASAMPQGPPGAPGVFTAKVKGKAIHLSWAPPAAGNTAEVTGYRVYRGLEEYDMDLLVELGVVTSYEDKDVVPGRLYYYKVVAMSDSGDSELSRVDDAKVPKEEEPGFGAMAAVLAFGAVLALAGRRRQLR